MVTITAERGYHVLRYCVWTKTLWIRRVVQKVAPRPLRYLPTYLLAAPTMWDAFNLSGRSVSDIQTSHLTSISLYFSCNYPWSTGSADLVATCGPCFHYWPLPPAREEVARFQLKQQQKGFCNIDVMDWSVSGASSMRVLFCSNGTTFVSSSFT